MNEKPMEWMAVCGEGMGHKLGRIVSLAAAVACFLFFVLTSRLFAVVGAALFAILYSWMQTHAFVEYEFCYFDGDLDVAAIFNKARRKKKMSIRLEDMEYMVKKVEPQQNTKYFCRRENEGMIYTLVVNQEGKRTAVVMEAAPEFVKIMEMKHKVR